MAIRKGAPVQRVNPATRVLGVSTAGTFGEILFKVIGYMTTFRHNQDLALLEQGLECFAAIPAGLSGAHCVSLLPGC